MAQGPCGMVSCCAGQELLQSPAAQEGLWRPTPGLGPLSFPDVGLLRLLSCCWSAPVLLL